MKYRYYITFGQRYATEAHPQGGHPNGWMEVEADNWDLAREKVIACLGSKWANFYDESDFAKDRKFYPLGCLKTLQDAP